MNDRGVEFEIGAKMLEPLNRLLAISARTLALLTTAAILLAAGNAYADGGAGVRAHPVGPFVSQQFSISASGSDEQRVDTAIVTSGRPASSAEPGFQRSSSGDTAGFERPSSHARSPSFPQALGMSMLAGLMLGLLPGTLPVASLVCAIVASGGARTSGKRGFILASNYTAGTVVAGLSTGLLGPAAEAHSSHLLLAMVFVALFIALALWLMADGFVQVLPQWRLVLPGIPGTVRSAGGFLAVAGLGALSAWTFGTASAAHVASTFACNVSSNGALGSAMALLAASVGLAVPLLTVGMVTAGVLKWAGPWKIGVKVYIAIELIATALLIVWPFAGTSLRIALGVLWLLVVVAELGLLSSRDRPGTIWRKPGRGIAAAAAIWTTLMLAVPVSRPVNPQDLVQHLAATAQVSVTPMGNRLVIQVI